MLTDSEFKTIDAAVEQIRGVVYPSREMIDKFPLHADEDITSRIAYVIGRVNQIHYDYQKNEHWTKCKCNKGL
jgi:hypothetical protein